MFKQIIDDSSYIEYTNDTDRCWKGQQLAMSKLVVCLHRGS